MAFVVLSSCGSCALWVPRYGWLRTPSRLSCPGGYPVVLSGAVRVCGALSACRRCRVQPWSFWRYSRTMVVINSASGIASPYCVSYAAAEASTSAWRSASSRQVTGTMVLDTRGRAVPLSRPGARRRVRVPHGRGGCQARAIVPRPPPRRAPAAVPRSAAEHMASAGSGPAPALTPASVAASPALAPRDAWPAPVPLSARAPGG